MKNESKKKSLLAVLRESLTKTGGCCGPGETCGGPGEAREKTATEEKKEFEETAKK